MKILLFKTLQRPEYLIDAFRSHYPGFASLRAYLNTHSKGHTVVYGNRHAHMQGLFDLIGFSSVTEAWPNAVQAMESLRAGGFTGPIVVGGPHITALPSTLPAAADCGVIGPGEETFKELVDAYSKYRRPDLSQIQGLVWRENGQLMSSSPRAQRPLDELPVDVLDARGIALPLSTVRGCPFHCTHCVERYTQGLPNALSAGKLLGIMERRVRATGNRKFFFWDDTFLAAKGRLEELHALMAQRNELGAFDIQMVSLNANLVEEHTIQLLKEIGVQGLGMGCESFNPRILKAIKKVVSLDDLARTIRLATTAGLQLGGSQVHGFPGETLEEMEDSILRVRELEKGSTFNHWKVFVCQPLPGSKLWPWAEQRGLVSEGMDFTQLRIDANTFNYFKSQWMYLNENTVPRKQFLMKLAEHDMLHGSF